MAYTLDMRQNEHGQWTYSGDVRGLPGLLWQAPKYPVMIADPPWWYADQKKERKDTKEPTRGIGACHHYDQMKTPEICKLPIAGLQDKRCLLFLWATCPLLPDALQVMDAWNFKFSTVAFVWVKLNSKAWAETSAWRAWATEILNARMPRMPLLLRVLTAITFFGPGAYTGSNVELVLLGTRKRARSIHHAKGHKASQLVFWPREEHSKKPEMVQDRIGWMYPNATPRLELFARREREGWDVLGNEV